MSTSPSADSPTILTEEELIYVRQRRVRHIINVEVRNLTPFPVRDAFASAMSQPADIPQFNAHGHLSDDIDVTISRKRNRKISVNSVHTLRSVKSDHSQHDDYDADLGAGLVEQRGRRRAASRASFQKGGSLGPTSGSTSTAWPSGSTPSVRPMRRPRTTSMASSINIQPPSLSVRPAASSSEPSEPTTLNSAAWSAMLPDNSQMGLERIIKSRLVETFLAITVPSLPNPDEHFTSEESASLTDGTSHDRLANASHNIISHTKTLSSSSISISARKSVRPSPLSPTHKAVKSTSQHESLATHKLSILKPAHKKSLSTTTDHANGRPTPVMTVQFPASTTAPGPLSRTATSSSNQSIPSFLSPIHRPSTNPSFPVNPKFEFGKWSDLSQNDVKIEIWGKTSRGPKDDSSTTDKGKGQSQVEVDDSVDWMILEEWNFDLADLVPLPDHLASNPALLPSNTLIITLFPPGQTFYLPSPRISISRSPSPSAGYNSDPESEVRRARQSEASQTHSTTESVTGDSHNVVALSRRRHRKGAKSAAESPGDVSKTATWQDLFKVVNLQTLIVDNENSLSEIVRKIDDVLEKDTVSKLKREVSERKSWVEDLTINVEQVKQQSHQLRTDIEARRRQLQERRVTLSLATQQQEDDLAVTDGRESHVEEARGKLLALRARFPPTRTTLLSTLASIFPIELVSPPDLLFTILDVPLPIPLSSTDPAPPLALPGHKEVNEDAVATSLGYAAQIIHLLATYLGKDLVYPVTCIGSRSLIRDGISAMVGPRMFPLFSKGVDTYRFEYGVFLLNKDIELLMADRDLRALDMRHTLPNLKNLLLTLTDGEGAQLHRPRSVDSPSPSVLELETPPHVHIPLPLDEDTHETPAEPASADAEEPSVSPLASGSTTPTATPEPSRKSRAFLGLSPLAGFLRSRYPSTSSRSPVKSIAEGSEEIENIPTASSTKAEADDGDDDDEDRRTIRGVVEIGVNEDDEQEQEGKNAVNGGGNENGIGIAYRRQKEKLRGDNVPAPPPTTPPPLVS